VIAGQARSGRRGIGTALPGRLAARSDAGRAAAAGAGAAGAGAAGAGAAAAGAAAAAGTRSARTAAAWPAGQPVSRFVSGPPDVRTRPGDGRTTDPYDSGADPAPPSAGSPYGDPPRRTVPSPSGTPYDEPAAGRPAADWDAGYDRTAGYRRDAGYDRGARHDRAAGYSPSGYDTNAGRGGGYADRGYSEPSYPDRDRYADRGGHPAPASHRRQGDQQSAWPSAGEQQGWPQDYEQPGSWPQDDQQRGRPRDYPAAREAADPGWYPPGHEGWSDQPGYGDALEALPPAEEVHHDDWSARPDRAARGWPAPGQDDEGEAW
jgi:hypothetical protein